MRAGGSDEDYPEIVFSGLVAEGQHAEQPTSRAAQHAQADQHFFGDAPLVQSRGVLVEPEEQKGEDAEGEEEIKHGRGFRG